MRNILLRKFVHIINFQNILSMKKHISILLVFVHAFVFVFLFYKQYLGLNLFLYELLTIATLIFLLKKRVTGTTAKIVLLGTLISGLSVVINFTAFGIIINICSFFLFNGVMVYPLTKSLVTSAALSFTNTFQSIGDFFIQLQTIKSGSNILKATFKGIKIGIIPIIILIVFILLYKASNPVFNDLLISIGAWFSNLFGDWITHVKFGIVFSYMLGLFFAILLLIKKENKSIISMEENATDTIKRVRKKQMAFNYKPLSLKSELKSALLLFVLLNTLIFIINCIDIYWVWFNFDWDGEYLKQFVHEGTYLLILSILISIGLVLFYFRGNLNFIKTNKRLKYLSYAWLAQNAILAISVGIRNLWYINTFSLAYKRIGVIFFLILVVYGLYTVYKKVRLRKSSFYLIRKNKLAAYCILIIISLFNWDIIIAKYNFAHSDTSFLHLDFMSDLSNKALPYLEKSIDELNIINKKQKELFPFEEEFMMPDAYHKKIEQRKENFMIYYSNKKWKSWNLAEWNAYNRLKVKSN